jgi:hypothetical protein
MAKAPAEAVAKIAATNIDNSLFMFKLSGLGWNETSFWNASESLEQE